MVSGRITCTDWHGDYVYHANFMHSVEDGFEMLKDLRNRSSGHCLDRVLEVQIGPATDFAKTMELIMLPDQKLLCCNSVGNCLYILIRSSVEVVSEHVECKPQEVLFW